LNGSIPSSENNPDYILEATKKYSVEVDAWFKDGDYYLGHEKPVHKIDKLFLFSDSIITHCKNIECLHQLRGYSMVEAFYQVNDEVSITTAGRFIYHSSVIPTIYKSNDIVVNLGKPDNYLSNFTGSISVLTDYPNCYELNAVTLDSELFDLLIIDIDGVMTNGTKLYNNSGDVLGKSFCDKDFTAIKRFKNAGISVCFLSGDKHVNQQMALDRSVDFYFARLANGNIDKSVFIKELKEKYKAKKIAYVGDDYYDITIMESVDISFSPCDAIEDVKAIANNVLSSPGGSGVIAEIYELYKHKISLSFAYDTYK
jgi:3-deoxy-D-manno-octulosonate 8-phosphate phosphatase (KDO 8-P phosphatase)